MNGKMPALHGIYWKKSVMYFYKHRIFYSKVLQIEGQNSFTEHFRDILVPVNRKFLAMVEEEEKGEHDRILYSFLFGCISGSTGDDGLRTGNVCPRRNLVHCCVRVWK